MGKKNRIRLSKQERQLYNKLQWFVKNKINWVGTQDLKEIVLDGTQYVVFSMTGDPYKTYAEHWDFDCFDTITGAKDLYEAKAIMFWNSFTHAIAVQLFSFSVAMEMRRRYDMKMSLPDGIDWSTV